MCLLWQKMQCLRGAFLFVLLCLQGSWGLEDPIFARHQAVCLFLVVKWKGPIDSYPSCTQNCWQIIFFVGRGPNFGKQIPGLITGHQQGIGWQIGQRIGCNKIVRVDARFSCWTENRIAIRFAWNRMGNRTGNRMGKRTCRRPLSREIGDWLTHLLHVLSCAVCTAGTPKAKDTSRQNPTY
jgi:hypothetical protein